MDSVGQVHCSVQWAEKVIRSPGKKLWILYSLNYCILRTEEDFLNV